MRQSRASLVRGLTTTAAIAVIATVAAPAEAALITWNTCSSTCAGGPAYSTASTRTSTGSGDTLSFTFDAVGDPTLDLDTRAFQSEDAFGAGATEQTTIRIFTGGLGSGYENTPEHSVDNAGKDEFIVFQFPEDDYTPYSFSIGWREDDADIVAYIGGTLGGPDDAFTQLLAGVHPDALGYSSQTFENVPLFTPQLLNGSSGAYLILAARNEVDGRKDGGEDKFKINQIVAETPADQVPEPGTLLLLGSGLLGLSARRRRRS